MNTYFPWEDHLLPMALQALDHDHADDTHHHPPNPLLAQAYQHCELITRQNSKTFYLASSLLPAEKSRSVRALYAFCRVTDDIVDREKVEIVSKLNAWQIKVRHPVHSQHIENIDSQTLVALAWRDARRRHLVPALYTEQLIDGVSYDLDKNRYQTFNELAAYCYGVACTVGLMSMHIVGHNGQDAIPSAIRLGVALQLTNILRDVGEDWRMGRLYLPQEELQAYNLTEADIASGQVTDKWRAFMRHQIEHVRTMYASALPGIHLLHVDGRFAIGAAAELYQAILYQIEKNDYDVFNRRAVVSGFDKLRRLPGIWWRARKGKYSQNLIDEHKSNKV